MKKTSSTKNSEKSRNLEETHLAENQNPILEFIQKSLIFGGMNRWVEFKTEEKQGKQNRMKMKQMMENLYGWKSQSENNPQQESELIHGRVSHTGLSVETEQNTRL